MTIIYFILILGGIVFFHELGHFIFAKRAGVYIYEFSIGMGPQIFKYKSKKDETMYSIRLFPIGGFVQMAGEEIEVDENIPKEKRMQEKKWYQRLLIMIAGVMFNFIMSILLLIIVGLVAGVPTNKMIVSNIKEDSTSYINGLRNNQQILKINGKKYNSTDLATLELIVNQKNDVELEVEEKGIIKKITIKADQTEDESYKYNFSLNSPKEKGILKAIKFGFTKTVDLISYVAVTFWYLIIGKISLSNLSGPIGIFSVVGETAKNGLINLVYLMALISANVGFINLLPFPAFDGGRVLFLIIEKIRGKQFNQKIENTINTVGFIILMILMVFITFNDILRLF